MTPLDSGVQNRPRRDGPPKALADDLGVDPGRVDDRIQTLLEAGRRIHELVEGQLKMV